MIDINLIPRLCEELNAELAGGRIEKIQQPAKDIILLVIRKDGSNRKLLISSYAGSHRIHITQNSYENPPEPPMFCMLLRKHLLGAEVFSIFQVNNDRIISLELRRLDDIGRSSNYQLVVEMLSKSPNVILVGEDGLIIDCIHRRDFDENLYRRVFPGMIYHIPQKKGCFEVKECIIEGSISQYLDDFYSKKEQEDLYRRKCKEVRLAVNSSIKRISRKLTYQREELLECARRDSYKHKADLITANIYRISKGDNVLICEDFYAEGCPTVQISLDPMKTPQNNAAKLYKEYNKLKTAEDYLIKFIDLAENQLDYLYSTLDFLDRARSDADISDIREELTEAGFLKKKGNRKKEKAQGPLMVGNFLVGRNNRQNDELTFRTARKSDLWFHAKGYHGSHVIFRGEEPTEEDIRQGCELAAKYSEAKGHCTVDFCLVKYVKKPSGAFPGKVIYSNYQTRIV